MKFKFCGDLDCPDWVLAEMNTLSKMMSMPALLTACIGLFFLGITSSSSLGLQHPELLSESANVKDVEPYDSKQNLQLMKVNQEEYAEKEANGGENQMGTLTEGSLQKRQAQHEGDGIYDSESEENSSENLVNKRLALIRRNAEEFGFKSRPGFRSWGGKRSKFTNWGGKRNPFSRWGGKRSKFNNWGGKRSGNAGVNVYDSQMASKLFAEAPDTVHAEERAYDFEKRDPEYPLPYEQDGDLPEIYLDQDFFKRDEFQTWAGKRAEKPMSPVVDYNKFSKWAGKRKFSNWAGKRGNAFAERPEDTSANWILRSYVDSILNTMKTEESGGKKIAVASRPFRDGADNEKTKVYSIQDTR